MSSETPSPSSTNDAPHLLDGFPGQHMVVLPAPLRRTLGQHPLLKPLFVTDAGYFPKAAGHHVVRPQGSPTDLLALCVQGFGWVDCGNRKLSINPGDLIWLSAHQPHAYGSCAQEPWSLLWVHFQGDELPEWKRLLGWDPKLPLALLNIGPERCAELALDQLYPLLEHGYSVPQLLTASASLRQTLCATLRLHLHTGSNRSARDRTLLVRDTILSSPAREFSLTEMANKARLSVPHFSLLFRQLTGYAPVDFLIRQRIRQSCRLLDDTRLSIAQIAAETGFNDPYYFSRCFKRIMGMPPLSYRKTVKA